LEVAVWPRVTDCALRAARSGGQGARQRQTSGADPAARPRSALGDLCAPADAQGRRAGSRRPGRNDDPLPHLRSWPRGPLRRLLAVAAARSADVYATARRYLGPDDTERTDRQELLRRVDGGEAVLLDVRPVLEYEAGHIPGSARFRSRSSPSGWTSCPPTSRLSPVAAALTASSHTMRCGYLSRTGAWPSG